MAGFALAVSWGLPDVKCWPDMRLKTPAAVDDEALRVALEAIAACSHLLTPERPAMSISIRLAS